MAKGLYIDARELGKGAKGMQRLIKEMPDRVSDVLNAAAIEIASKARERAPANRGASGLKGGIQPDTKALLKKHVTSHAPYSAYVEFGTGKYAAQEVAKLPADFKKFAAQFQIGSGKRSIKGMLFVLMGWFKDRGITDKDHQYFIARNIFINGTHPHPFLLPAFFEQQDDIKKDMKTLLNQLRIK